jgi:hypothetical protein
MDLANNTQQPPVAQQPLPQSPPPAPDIQVIVQQPVVSQPQPTPPEEAPPENDTWMKPLYILLAICSVIIVSILLWLFLANKTKTVAPQVVAPTQAPRQATSITGNIIFEGYVPQDAYLVIAERSEGKKEFKAVVSGIVPQTGMIPWTWTDATIGSNYDIQAQLKVKGLTVQESAVTTVSAPGSDVNLTLVSEQQPPQPQQAQISGTVHLHGYIPNGSTITILATESTQANYQTIVSGITATDNTGWAWSNAQLGKTYDIKAQLKDGNGTLISSDTSKTITAPSSGILFEITSFAQPPAPLVTGLSGTININGSIPPNSYITLGTRKTGTATFNQVASNISATDDIAWSWTAAQAGAPYDVQAYLWSNSKPYAQSQILTVTAPSQNDVLTINAQTQLAAPTGDTINVSCNSQQNGSFQATINYNTKGNLSNVQSYNIVATLASQGNQVVNTTVSPNNPTQPQSLTTTYIFTSGATYYAQYAYSTGNNIFSPLSPAVQFSCR